MKYYLKWYQCSNLPYDEGDDVLLPFDSLEALAQHFYDERDLAKGSEIVHGKLVEQDYLEEIDRLNAAKRQAVEDELAAKKKAKAEERKRKEAEDRKYLDKALKAKAERDMKERERLRAIRASAYEKLNDEERALLKVI